MTKPVKVLSIGCLIVVGIIIFAVPVLIYVLQKNDNEQAPRSEAETFEEILIDFDRLGIPGTNWYDPDISSDGMIYQWTSDRVATLDVPFQTTDNSADIEFCVVYSVPGAADTLELQANGQEIPLFRANTPSCPFWFSGRIAQETLALSPGQTKLTFLTTVTGTGDSVVHNGDMRPFSVAFDWLRLKEVSYKTVFIDFDQPNPGTNWHYSEVSPEGITYEWTSDRTATLEVYLQTVGGAKIEFCIVQSMLNAADTLKLQVNGQNVVVFRVTTNSCPYLFQGEISQEVMMLNPDKTELTFSTEIAELGENVAHNGDMRLLSVAFDWLRLSSID